MRVALLVSTIAAGLAAAPALSQSDADSAFADLVTRAEPEEMEQCRAALPPGVTAPDENAIPLGRVRERYIVQVRAMGLNGLHAEHQRLTNLHALALEGRSVGFSAPEIAAQRAMVDEAIAHLEKGVRLDPAANSYRSYLDANVDEDGSRYRREMANCLKQMIRPRINARGDAVFDPAEVAATRGPAGRAPLPNVRRLAAPRFPDAARRVPEASAAQITACHGKVSLELREARTEAQEVLKFRENYAQGVPFWGREELEVEKVRLTRTLGLMRGRASSEDPAQPNTYADVSARLGFVEQVLDAQLEGRAVATNYNSYNGFVMAADLARAKAEDRIEQSIADCAREAMTGPTTTTVTELPDLTPDEAAGERAQLSWAGTYVGGKARYTISGTSTNLTVSYQGFDGLKQSGSATCTVSGDDASCRGAGNYEDEDKSIAYTETWELTRQGDTISGRWKLPSATPNWRPGVATYTPVLHTGNSGSFSMTRVKQP